jgi:hypothetical protein
VEGYAEESKGHVSKSFIVQTLKSCRLAPANFSANQWNANSLGMPYSIKYLAIKFVIY